jgi:uncharacterized membrane protein
VVKLFGYMWKCKTVECDMLGFYFSVEFLYLFHILVSSFNTWYLETFRSFYISVNSIVIKFTLYSVWYRRGVVELEVCYTLPSASALDRSALSESHYTNYSIMTTIQ